MQKEAITGDGETIDFTRYRKGSKPRGRPICHCPRCGRKGERTNYSNGGYNYIHKMHRGLFGFWVVTDSCGDLKGGMK